MTKAATQLCSTRKRLPVAGNRIAPAILDSGVAVLACSCVCASNSGISDTATSCAEWRPRILWEGEPDSTQRQSVLQSPELRRGTNSVRMVGMQKWAICETTLSECAALVSSPNSTRLVREFQRGYRARERASALGLGRAGLLVLFLKRAHNARAAVPHVTRTPKSTCASIPSQRTCWAAHPRSHPQSIEQRGDRPET
jgi:hypothetical protein